MGRRSRETTGETAVAIRVSGALALLFSGDEWYLPLRLLSEGAAAPSSPPSHLPHSPGQALGRQTRSSRHSLALEVAKAWVRWTWKSSDFQVLNHSYGEGNGSPLQCSCLENPIDREAWRDTYSSWGHKGSDSTEQVTYTHHHS